jgi:hypothetical protein
MKRLITLLSLVGLAALNTACAEETGSAKETTSAAQNAGAGSEGNIIVAQNTTASRSSVTVVKESGSTRSVVDLMAKPYRDAKLTGQLPANTAVDIHERQGGWMRISAKGKTGWAKLHQIRVGEGPEAKKSGEGLAVLKNVGQTGRSGSQGIVATTGIRGMSAEELKRAKPDPAAVKTVDGYRITTSQAREYAKAAGLKESIVPVLPKPE